MAGQLAGEERSTAAGPPPPRAITGLLPGGQSGGVPSHPVWPFSSGATPNEGSPARSSTAGGSEEDPRDEVDKKILIYRLRQGLTLENAKTFVSHLKTRAVDMLYWNLKTSGHPSRSLGANPMEGSPLHSSRASAMEDDPNDGAKRENLSFRLCQGQSLEDAIKFVSHLKTEAMDMMCCKIGQPGCSSEGVETSDLGHDFNKLSTDEPGSQDLENNSCPRCSGPTPAHATSVLNGSPVRRKLSSSSSCSPDDKIPDRLGDERVLSRLERIISRLDGDAELPSCGMHRHTVPTVAPPPGLENVVHQPWDSDAAAGPRSNGVHAPERHPRPDGSNRHITEKGKRRQQKRRLAHREARRAQRGAIK